MQMKAVWFFFVAIAITPKGMLELCIADNRIR